MLSSKRFTTLLSFALISVSVAGCGFRPAYGPAGVQNTASPMQAQMKDIRLDVPKDRLGIQLSNELGFLMNGGDESGKKPYVMKISLTPLSQSTGIEPTSGLPTSVFYSLVAEYTLVDSNTKKVLTKGKTFARTDFDFSGQRFANVRAQRDAENRAIAVLATQLHHHLLGYYAKASQ